MAIRNENDLLFYRAVGALLTKRLSDSSLTAYTLSAKLGLQFNTINGMLKGRPFYAHQLIRIMDELSVSLEDIINEIEGIKSEEETSKVEDLI